MKVSFYFKGGLTMVMFFISITFALMSFLFVYLRVSDSVSARHSKTYLKKHKKGWRNKLFFIDFKEDIHKLNLILLYFNYAVIALCIFTAIIALFLEDKNSVFAFAFKASVTAIVIEGVIGLIEAVLNFRNKISTPEILAIAAIVIVAVAGFVLFVIDYFDVDFSYILFGE